MSCPHTPAQNGRAKCKHRHITETGLAMLFHSHMPTTYWLDAFCFAIYIINRLPTPLLKGISPFELLYDVSPNYAHFHPFGCQVYPYLHDYAPHKLSPRSIPCIFLGYSSMHKGFWCMDVSTSQIYFTCHAKFDEFYFPFSNTGLISSILHLGFSLFDEPSKLVIVSPPAPSKPSSQSSMPLLSRPCGLCPSKDTSPVVLVPPAEP